MYKDVLALGFILFLQILILQILRYKMLKAMTHQMTTYDNISKAVIFTIESCGGPMRRLSGPMLSHNDSVAGWMNASLCK